MNNFLNQINKTVYENCDLLLSNFSVEKESNEYEACMFELKNKKVRCRNAKITPTKSGQFVTFWKRNAEGIIEPFHENDSFDFFVVIVRTEDALGQFVLPKPVLIKQAIISTNQKEGKRAFRVYPIWDSVTSIQAEKTQKWQSDYFFEINANTDLKKVHALFQGV